MDFSSFILGVSVALAVRHIIGQVRRLRSKPAPAPPRAREEGDVVLNINVDLPVLLIEKLSHDEFRGCYITPHAGKIGATVNNERVDECKDILIMRVNDRKLWPDYPHPLSDKEQANLMKMMLTK
jgi:hypothetical protein